VSERKQASSPRELYHRTLTCRQSNQYKCGVPRPTPWQRTQSKKDEQMQRALPPHITVHPSGSATPLNGPAFDARLTAAVSLSQAPPSNSPLIRTTAMITCNKTAAGSAAGVGPATHRTGQTDLEDANKASCRRGRSAPPPSEQPNEKRRQRSPWGVGTARRGLTTPRVRHPGWRKRPGVAPWWPNGSGDSHLSEPRPQRLTPRICTRGCDTAAGDAWDAGRKSPSETPQTSILIHPPQKRFRGSPVQNAQSKRSAQTTVPQNSRFIVHPQTLEMRGDTVFSEWRVARV